MPLAPGQTLTHYEIVARIGAGGMGEVWRARDTRLEREVAIKVLPEELAGDRERLQRFEREAKTLASLNHPNVAGIHGIDQEGDTRFIAMELVPGEDLAERLARGALPVDEAVDVGRQIAEGLEAAHEAGVVHRDLKPANVRITPDGVVKILDFGLAKPVVRGAPEAEPDGSFATSEGVVLGTPTYMSPEQARGKPVDRRTDLWAFGCVLYECLTGRRAFTGRTFSDVLAEVVSAEPDWSALPAGTSPSVRHLLRRSLVKDPRNRLRDAGDARLELTDAAGGGAGPAGEAASPFLARIVFASALVGLGAAIALAVVRPWMRAPRNDRPTLLDLRPPAGTRFALEPTMPAPVVLSPDGSRVAFGAATRGEPHKLWVRELDTGRARVLPGTEFASYPFWSPSGEHLGFFADGKLMRAELDGTPPRPLADAPSGKGGSWGASGWIVFAPDVTGALHAVREVGGEVRAVTDTSRAPRAASHRHPRFLPDGEHFLFLARDAEGGSVEARHAIVGSSLDGALPRVVTWGTSQAELAGDQLVHAVGASLFTCAFDEESLELVDEPLILLESAIACMNGAALGLFSTSGDRLVLHLGAYSDVSRIVRLDLAGQEVETLRTPLIPSSIAVDPDGDWLFARLLDVRAGTAELWGYRFDVEEWSRLPLEAQAGNPVSAGEDELIYSVDESRIERASLRGTAQPTVLIDEGEGLEPLDVSPDGQWLVFERDAPDGREELCALSLVASSAAREVRVLAGDGPENVNGLVSPDGHWLGYSGRDASGWHAYVQPFPDGGRRHEVSGESSAEFMGWHPDGDRLYLLQGDGLFEVRFRSDARSFEKGATRYVGDIDPAPGNFPVLSFRDDSFWTLLREGWTGSDAPARIVLDWPVLLERR